MKLSINNVLGLLGGALLTAASPASWAAVTPTLNTGVQTVVVPLSPPQISAGVDAPVGTVLYQASLIMKDGSVTIKWLSSDVGKYLYYTTSAFVSNIPQPLANLTTGPYANGVYQTGIPGIGVAILSASGTPITTTRLYAESQNLLGSELGGVLNHSGASNVRNVVLVKTGPLTPGTYTASGANFPTVTQGMDVSQTSHTNAAATSGLPIYDWIFSFQGSITVSAQTCTTPDVAVTLGTYAIAENFTALNSTTPWIDASVALINCPKFYGFYNSTNAPLLMNYNTGTGTSTTSLNNSIGVRLTPATSVVDAANGIMAIDSTLVGAASGVGIQLGWGDSSQTPTLFNFAAEKTITLPKDGTSTIRVPLSARYIQTATTPTPGKANGKVTFTISYY
ncbi:fimbrial protein [Serratia fonticola]|uniref:fimbrial protein n=1 Tax=Serratia fonticola TaxID=47917 RepID=UPI001ED8F7E6|nr:type 1 fimbrial protein [Serratia fonticola]